jgi:transposase-like protein
VADTGAGRPILVLHGGSGPAGLTQNMATRKRHTPEQVVRKLATADRMLGEGKDVADICRELQVSEQTYYRWRNQFGGLKADDAKRLKELKRENSTLKRLLADPSWRRPRSRRSPGETSEPGVPAGSRAPPHDDHGCQ